MLGPGTPPQDREARERARAVRLMVFDVDGVLTDGRLWYGPQGDHLKVFHVRDGHGLRLLSQAGIVTALLSGRDSPAVSHRAAELGIAHVLQGIGDKGPALDALAAKLGIAPAQIGAMGDDLPDLPMLRRCGFAAAPPGAHPMVRALAHYESRAEAGAGAVREVCEYLLVAQDRWDSLVARESA